MGKIRRIVLDVLKPHEPTILDMASKISDIEGVDGADIAVYSIEKRVESIKITIEGSDIRYPLVKKIIEDCGANVQSMDKVSCGSKVVEEVETPQDVN